MANRVVYDIELGRGAGYTLAELDYSGFQVAVTWSDADGFVHWFGRQGRELLGYLIEHREVVGFNLLSYDNRVIAGYLMDRERWRLTEQLKERTVDLHRLLQEHSGRRVSLQEVATNTLQAGKLTPPRDGDALQMLDYCERDVELTRDLDDFRRAYGVLYIGGGVAIHLPVAVATG